MHRARFSMVVLATVLLLAAASVQAQWVMVGKAAANRIQRMTQKSGSGGYDVATVVLDAAPAKVYETAIKTLKENPEVSLTKQDEKNLAVQFKKGNLVAGLHVTSLGEKVAQLVIASSVGDETKPSATPLVLDRVMNICREMKVHCELQQE